MGGISGTADVQGTETKPTCVDAGGAVSGIALHGGLLRRVCVPAVDTSGSHCLRTPGMGMFLDILIVCVEVGGRGNLSKMGLVEHVR